MPIPPPEAHRKSNLTKKQQQEQLAVCYGVPMAQQLSESEVANLRQILAQHDSQHQPMRVIDLNNPPKDQYRFQKFPMMVYDLENSHPAFDKDETRRNGMGIDTVHHPAKVIFKIVGSEEELQYFLDSGWSEKAPDFTAEREEPLSAKYANEAGKINAEIEEKRRGPGRPKQVA